MADVKKRKLVVISSESESSEESGNDSVWGISSPNSRDDESEGFIEVGDNDIEWKDSGDEEFDDPNIEKDDEETMRSRVVHHLRVRNDIQLLKLVECKAYLRKYGLRLSGTKEDCISRIKEHWRLKDGNGEMLYPKSSFTIDCTGDVCKGDVVLFNQKVYLTYQITLLCLCYIVWFRFVWFHFEFLIILINRSYHLQNNYSKMKKRGRVSGSRTIAGRIVKESYGATRQQHTFTVEVIWSRGIKRLPLLFPLLVKGRNLYKYKTYRQPWDSERERSKVLAEKHERGAMARNVREIRREMANRHKDAKRRKHLQVLSPSKTINKAHPSKIYMSKLWKNSASEEQSFHHHNHQISSKCSRQHRNHSKSVMHESPSWSYYHNGQDRFERDLHHSQSHISSAHTYRFPRYIPLPNHFSDSRQEFGREHGSDNMGSDRNYGLRKFRKFRSADRDRVVSLIILSKASWTRITFSFRWLSLSVWEKCYIFLCMCLVGDFVFATESGSLVRNGRDGMFSREEGN